MIEIDFSQVKEMLEDMIGAIKDPDQVLEEEVGPILRKSAEDQFARGGYPDPWKRLSPVTVQNKAYQGYPRRNRTGGIPGYTLQGGRFGPENILIRTGSLRVSWTNEAHPFHVCTAYDGVLTFGSSMPYAVYHQSDKPRKKLPRRPVVIDDHTLAECATAFVFGVVFGPSHSAKGSRRRKP